MAKSETITREEFDSRLDASNERRRVALEQSEAEQNRVEQLLAKYEQMLDDMESELRSESEPLTHSARLRRRLQELASKTTEIAASL